MSDTHSDITTPIDGVRRGAFLIGGALATIVSGIFVQAVVQPASTVPDDRWTYPWSSNAQIPVSIVYAAFHLLVIIGLFEVRRAAVTGPHRSGRIGMDLAIVGTALLLVGELASIPIRHANLDDTSAVIVGILFAFGVGVSAIGFLMAGIATVRSGRWHDWRRWTLLATGVWLVALVALSMTKALPTGVADTMASASSPPESPSTPTRRRNPSGSISWWRELRAAVNCTAAESLASNGDRSDYPRRVG